MQTPEGSFHLGKRSMFGPRTETCRGGSPDAQHCGVLCSALRRLRLPRRWRRRPPLPRIARCVQLNGRTRTRVLEG